MSYAVPCNCLLLGTTLAYADQPENHPDRMGRRQAHEAPDFIAVIDFDSDSPKLRQILRIDT